jgi:hypothetical protein
VEEFIVVLKKFEERLVKEIKRNTPMLMSTQDEVDSQAATCCSFCNRDLGTDRVRDHDHLTGKYRGASHNQCNLTEGIKRTKNYKVPVFFSQFEGIRLAPNHRRCRQAHQPNLRDSTEL